MVFTQLTLDPSLGLGEMVGVGAHFTAEHNDFTTAAKNFKGWINLCGSTSTEQCDEHAIQATGTKFVRVPVEVSNIYRNIYRLF